ncbi:MAG: GNAT family N-acetyltransferase [Christensenellales bacterium]|jgi:GNAT superfamily N-acetyltransferase
MIDIRKLTPELVEDYIGFFDVTPHNHRYNGAKCYCVYWCSGVDEEANFSTKAARRDYAIQAVKDGRIQGYLAYRGDEVVGWCNANAKSACLKCKGWQMMNGKRKGFIPTEEATPQVRVKSVFCFTIAPKARRQGVATELLARVCQDAAQEGFDFVEAYPDREVTDNAEDFVGYAQMYLRQGFEVYHETNRKRVMRKPLR